MRRAVLTTGLALLFVAGPRLCCLLTCLTATQTTTAHAAANPPEEPRGCGCCHHQSDPELPPPSNPEPPKCPFEKWHDETKLTLSSPEQTKPVNGPSSGECYAESSWHGRSPVFGHGREVSAATPFNSGFPFLLPTDILHHLCTYRC